MLSLVPSLVAASDIVRLDSGLVSSALRLPDGVRIFKGIPFAAPPVGNLRWRSPQPPAHWSGVRKADKFGPECMQPYYSMSTPFGRGTREEMSENCLYLNVWTPANAAHQRLPVMVWIYGGGFYERSSSLPLTNGHALARMGVVVVSFNYRLGVFGFFAYPQLTTSAGTETSGDYGLLDMIAALKGVHKHLAAFGGNPKRVTIFGESAGSLAVSYLMASPLAKGLFQRAIGESGSALTGPLVPLTLAGAEQQAREFAQFAGARSLVDLRAIPPEQMCKLSEAFVRKNGGLLATFWPYIDGSFLPAAPYNIFAKGKQHNVPLLVGSNADDGQVALQLYPICPPQAFVEQARRRFGSQAGAYLKLYPANSEQQATRSEVASLTDWFFAAPMRDWVQLQTETGKAKAYLYLFSHGPPVPAASYHGAFHGAFHAAEVFYVFDSMNLHPNWAWTEADRRLSRTMMSYWVNFARMGNPNGRGLPHWPAYNEKDQEVMDLGTRIEARQEPDRRRLDWWVAWFAKQRIEAP